MEVKPEASQLLACNTAVHQFLNISPFLFQSRSCSQECPGSSAMSNKIDNKKKYFLFSSSYFTITKLPRLFLLAQVENPFFCLLRHLWFALLFTFMECQTVNKAQLDDLQR